MQKLKVKYDPRLEGASYVFTLDEERYVERLKEDLGFDDTSLSRLTVTALHKSLRPGSWGYYNKLTRNLLVKPGLIWRSRPSGKLATQRITENLMHESKHAAQQLVEGQPLIDTNIVLKRSAVRMLSLALAYGEHRLLNTPGLDYADALAVGTYLAVSRIGQGRIYARDHREIAAYQFQHDPDAQTRWQGVATLQEA